MRPSSPDSSPNECFDASLLESVLVTTREACDKQARDFSQLASLARELELTRRPEEQRPQLLKLIKMTAERAEDDARRSVGVVRRLHKNIIEYVIQLEVEMDQRSRVQSDENPH